MNSILNAAIAFLLIASLVACSSPEEKATDYVENANRLFEEGELGKATIEYKNALQVNQNLAAAWYGLARIHKLRHEWRQTYIALKKLRELFPNHVDGRIMLGQMLLASNQLDRALIDAREVLELAPDDARSHSLMAALQFRLGNFDSAQDEVDQALAIDPGNHDAILVRSQILIAGGNHAEAIALLDGAMESSPDNAGFYLMKIQAYADTGNGKGIEQVYLALISQFPKIKAFKQSLLQHYLNDNDIDSAEDTIERLVQSDPDNVELKLQMASLKYQFRSTDEATALLKTYIDSNREEYRYRFLLADLYERSEQSDMALKVYEEIVAEDGLQPNGLEARNKIALIKLRSDDREIAESLVREVLSQDNNNENGLLLQAGFHIANRKYDDALISARTVLRNNPNSARALALLAQAYNSLGSSELELESIAKAFEINKETPAIANQFATALIRKRQFTRADEVLEESIIQGNRSLEALRLWTQVKLASGEWDKAEELARELKKIEGQEALSELFLGEVYQGQQRQGESIEAFKRAHYLAPSATQPVVSLVKTFVRTGKMDEARQFLNDMLRINKESITAYMLLARLSLAENKPEEAVRYFNKAIEIDPKEEVAYLNLATVFRQNGQIDQEEEIIKRALIALPERPVLIMSQASIYERQGYYDKAIAVYESVLEVDPESLVAKNNLVSLLSDHRQDQASLERARTMSTVFRSSEIPQFRDTYAWASVKLGTNLEEAVVILEGIVKENAQVDAYHYHLGEAYRKKGDSDNAKTYLSRAVELTVPGSEVGAKAKESLLLLN